MRESVAVSTSRAAVAIRHRPSHPAASRTVAETLTPAAV